MIDITSYPKLIRGLFIGQSRSTSEGVWVQGGGIEIPCAEERFDGKPATTDPNSSQYYFILPVLMGTDCCYCRLFKD